MTTALVLDAVEHAFFTRAQEGRRDAHRSHRSQRRRRPRRIQLVVATPCRDRECS
jgi:hypothetical protein